MKTRPVFAVDLVLCAGAFWTYLSWLFILVIISMALHHHQVWTAPGQSPSSMPRVVTSSPRAATTSKLESSTNETQLKPDVLARLSKVFGISRIPHWEFSRSPPQYMQELYASLTDTGGLTRASGPYNSNIIRSFPDKDSVHRMHFLYNISYLEEREHVLQAEFHLFKMKAAPAPSHEPAPSHVILIKIYQVLDTREMTSQHNLRLLDARRISAHAHGWHVFNVTSAVLEWQIGTADNFGFLVTAETSTGFQVKGSSYIRFAQRNEHHDSKQPILVVFTDDGQRKHPNYISPDDEGYVEIKEDILRRQKQKQHHKSGDFKGAIRMLNEKERVVQRKSPANRTRRAAKKKNTERRKRTYETYRYRHNRSCTRYEMFVDFEEIGWSGWIISPNSYNAYHCAGDCPFPLGQSQKPTNHATVQSIVHALGVGKNINTPCCVPNKLYSISLLYFDDNENVILKQYDDMVVASCGCH